MIIDLHNDVITELAPAEFKRYLEEAEKNDVAELFISIWCSEMKEPLKEIKNYKKQLDELKTNIKLNIHIEDCHFLKEENLDEFFDLRPFSTGLVWNKNNKLAGGACADGGLTLFGKKVIRECQKNNVLVDLAHLNRKSFWQVCDEINGCLLCTHTCFEDVNSHPRNLDYYQIKTIKESNGLIGLTFVPEFLTDEKTCNYKHLLEHITYFLEKFGDDNLAIGSDFYGSKNYPEDLTDYNHFKKLKRFLIKNKIPMKSIEKIFFSSARKFLKEQKNEL